MDGDTIDAPPPCTTPAGFGAEMSFDVGAVGKGLAVGALDGMAGRDVVIAVGTDTILLHGDNAGTFSNPRALGSVAGNVVIEDFDGIGFDDLILIDVGGTAVVERLQTSGGVFGNEIALAGPFTNVHDAFVAPRLDGNFRADLIVVDNVERAVFTSNSGGGFSKDNAFGSAGDEVVFVGTLEGTIDDAVVVDAAGNVKLVNEAIGAGIQIATGATGKGIGFGNFNDDALLDLMVARSDGGHLYTQNAANLGTFTEQPGAIPGITSTQPLLVADVNGDGTDDIITANRVVLQCPTTRVFTQIENINAKAPVVLVDVTNNSKPDLLRLEGTALKVRVE